MKKVLLLSLGLVMGLGTFAQTQMRMPKGTEMKHEMQVKKFYAGTEQVQSTSGSSFVATPTIVQVPQSRYDELLETQVIMTTQDNQSNSGTSNRLVQWADGSAAVVTTLSHEFNASMPDRGTGYNFFNGDDGNFFAGGGWNEMPDSRIESIRTGWPTISNYGADGEILAWHGGGVFFMTRDVKGEGEWSDPIQVPNPSAEWELSWPRIAVSGESNNIIHIVSADQDASNASYLFYARSEDGGATWTSTSMPGIEEENLYSADDYSIVANGDNVAVLLFGGTTSSVVLVKSTDNGLNWTSRKVWVNPYEGFDWATDENSIYTDTMFGPANVALTVDKYGVSHVVMSTYEYIHSELGDTYTVWSGRSVDGIAYWNDTQEGPISAENGNPHDALRLWWPDPENPGYVTMDTPELYKFCGYLPMYEDVEFDQDKLYDGQDYFYKFYSRCSAQPCISVDPQGMLAVAYSCPNATRENGSYYCRSVYMSYKDENATEWTVCEDDLMEGFMHQYSDGIWVSCSPVATNPSEFFVTYMEDGEIGIFNFNNTTGAPYGTNQTDFTDNYVNVVRITTPFVNTPEMINPLTSVSVYPNPASADQTLNINSSMSADAVVTFHNIVGQVVKSFNTTLNTGVNGISINELNSGVYFCTINANGFSKTVKVVVK